MNENLSANAAEDQSRACNKRSVGSTADAAPDGAHSPQLPIENQKSTIKSVPLPHGRGSEIVDESIPIPPRYWWLKRIAVGVAALLVFLIALRLWWGWEANRRLQAEIDRIVAAGEPIFPEDFNPKVPIPDEENAATSWLAAAAALVLSSDDEKLLERVYKRSDEVLPLKDELASVWESNQPVFELVRQASTVDKCDWGTRYRTPVVANIFPMYVPQRQLSWLLSGMAAYRHGIGDDLGSLELLLQGFAQGRALATEPSLLGHMLSTATNIQIAGSLERILPTLKVAPIGSGSHAAPAPGTHRQTQQLRNELLENSFLWDSFHRAVMAERMVLLDSAQFCARDPAKLGILTGGAPPNHVVLGRLLSPMYVLDGCFALRLYSPLIDAARKQNYPRDIPGTFESLQFATPSDRYLHPVSSELLSSLDRGFVRHYRALSSRQMAAIALAIRLYEIDQGHRPVQLDELIPQYLSQIPTDPFSTEEHSIQYLPNAAKPILYSVGPDGKDDQGQYQLRRNGGIDWDELDVPFFLNGDRYDAEHAGDGSP